MIIFDDATTNEDALAAWDRGESVWSCELGGLGPGYEQCIQLMGFEMLRTILANPPPVAWTDMEENPDAVKAWWKSIENAPEMVSIVTKLRPSGAQYGAARNLASVFARNGYGKGMALVPDDRRIQVSKNFPQV